MSSSSSGSQLFFDSCQCCVWTEDERLNSRCYMFGFVRGFRLQQILGRDVRFQTIVQISDVFLAVFRISFYNHYPRRKVKQCALNSILIRHEPQWAKRTFKSKRILNHFQDCSEMETSLTLHISEVSSDTKGGKYFPWQKVNILERDLWNLPGYALGIWQ